MKFAQLPQEEDEGGIDLTPMLDVVFIMLIFFIVTASFLKEAGVEAQKPESQEAPPTSDAQSIVIRIANDGQIYIGPRRVDIRSVRANVERLRAEQPDAAVVVQAQKDARNELVVKSLDAARLAGAYDVVLAEWH